jgi:hypothetical protein
MTAAILSAMDDECSHNNVIGWRHYSHCMRWVSQKKPLRAKGWLNFRTAEQLFNVLRQ